MIQSTNSLAVESIHYSSDGYVRLTFPQFCSLQFAKRLAVHDDDLLSELLDQDVPAFSAGYCDWLDDSTPVQVSVGWAWFAATEMERPKLADGGISTNVMLTCPAGNDLGADKTEQLLIAWLAARSWHADELAEFDKNSDALRASVH